MICVIELLVVARPILTRYVIGQKRFAPGVVNRVGHGVIVPEVHVVSK